MCGARLPQASGGGPLMLCGACKAASPCRWSPQPSGPRLRSGVGATAEGVARSSPVVHVARLWRAGHRCRPHRVAG